MRFNLEPGDTACDGRSKLVAVKINNEERINLPFTSYVFDKDYFIIPSHSGTIHLRSFVNTLIKRYCSKYVMGLS